MKNIVLDTNCLLASLSRNKEEYIIWKSLQEGRYNICVTNEILDEYVEVLQRNISPTIAENVMFLLLNIDNIRFIHTYYQFHLINADPDDNKFVDCAIASNAQYVVTNDAHFNAQYVVTNDAHFKELDSIGFPKVNHIRIDDFVAMLKKSKKK